MNNCHRNNSWDSFLTIRLFELFNYSTIQSQNCTTNKIQRLQENHWPKRRNKCPKKVKKSNHEITMKIESHQNKLFVFYFKLVFTRSLLKH